ncbi:unnamed protein product, partial [Symbiodinium sp. CCMP2592]
MRCMVADCQQTAGSNPLRAAGKAAGVQLGWWTAGKKKCYVCDTHRSSASRKANTPTTALTAEEAHETLRGFLETLQTSLPSNARIYYNQRCHAWHAMVGRKNVRGSYQSLSKHATHAAALQATVAALRNHKIE